MSSCSSRTFECAFLKRHQIDYDVHAIMGKNGSGKSTFSKVLVGHPDYRVTGGTAIFKGENLLDKELEERSHAGLFMSFRSPVEVPGVSNMDFLQMSCNARRAKLGLPELGPLEFYGFLSPKLAALNMDPTFLDRNVNEGFSGGEKKRNEILQLAVVEALRGAGLESSNLIVGIDFTKSNGRTGRGFFYGRSLHTISSRELNPCEQAIQILGKTLSAFDDDNLIPSFGFGDVHTGDRSVFGFHLDGQPCHGFEEVLARYTEIVPHLNLSGLQSFKVAYLSTEHMAPDCSVSSCIIMIGSLKTCRVNLICSNYTGGDGYCRRK